MRARAFLTSVLGLVAACGSTEQLLVGELEASVVYGNDDRVEVYASADEEHRRIAQQSIVALIPASRVQSLVDGSFGLLASSLKDRHDLGDDEPFANQPVAASCSGVLIADDLVLTAGHCVGDSRSCTLFNYVFDYYLEAPDRLASIDAEDVYSCSRIVLDEDSFGSQLTPDFAIIQLDRPVTGSHFPATVRAASPLSEGSSLTMMGSGSGLPVKIDAGASIADARAERGDYFVANLDAFEGHSGSATFDEQNELAGILIGGRVPDYVFIPEENCTRVNRFDDSMAGEIVHNIAPIIASLCDSGEGDETLCDPDACDGAPCGAHPTPPDDDMPPSTPGVVAGSASGCRVATGEAHPSLLMLLLVGWLAIRRVRQRAS